MAVFTLNTKTPAKGFVSVEPPEVKCGNYRELPPTTTDASLSQLPHSRSDFF